RRHCQGRLELATTVWTVRTLTLRLEQFAHCPEQPCGPHPKLHVYRPSKPQAFSHPSLPSQTAVTWDFFSGTDTAATAGFFALSARHFAIQSLSVIPAA